MVYVSEGQIRLVIDSVQDLSALSVLICLTDGFIKRRGLLTDASQLNVGDDICILPRLRGGKGGFGSMLRAIGAQIEKTTNREACRDLSGRRLRDINDEKRLKSWIDKQAEREKEATEKKKAKKQKLENIVQQSKHQLDDKSYLEQKEKQSNAVHDAVECVTAAAAGSSGEGSSSAARVGVKRPASSTETTSSSLKKRTNKGMMWMDPDISDCSDLSVSDEDDADNADADSKLSAVMKN